MAGKYIASAGSVKDLENLVKGAFVKGVPGARIAMVGRSNVGKSSLINALLGAKLAHTSANPGKTKLISFFSWDEPKKIVVDLPGYGYAKVAMSERERWAGFINAYLKTDEALERALVLLDARHGPTPLDCEAIGFLSFSRIPVTFVFTKSDQLKTQSERAKRRKETAEALKRLGFDGETGYWVSAKSRDGIDQLRAVLKG
jgi:GTP-binding protein